MHACRYLFSHLRHRRHLSHVYDEYCRPLHIFVSFPKYLSYPLGPNRQSTFRFLVAQASAGFVCLMAWSSSTASDNPEKRAVALALINAVSQSGNIAGSFVWAKAWEPTYNKSFAICAAFGVVSIIMCLWLRTALTRINQQMDRRDGMDGDVVNSSGRRWRYHI